MIPSNPLTLVAKTLGDGNGGAFSGVLATDGTNDYPVFPGQSTQRPVSSFSRLANTTAYASGQLIANSATAGAVAPLSWTVARGQGWAGSVIGASIIKVGSLSSLPAIPFRLHLYSASPTLVNGDGGAWETTDGTVYLDSIDITLTKLFANGSIYGAQGRTIAQIPFVTAAGSQQIFGLIEARGAYTPASGETFNVALEVIPD